MGDGAKPGLPFPGNFLMLCAVKQRRTLIGLMFFTLAAGLGWLVVQRTQIATFTLPDGSRLYVRGVTVGSNVTVHFGSGLDKILARMPGKLGVRFQRNQWRDQLDGERLIFWFEFERAQRSNTTVDVQFTDAARLRTNRTESWLPVQTLPNGRMIADVAQPGRESNRPQLFQTDVGALPRC
jgi:hypothetical protein